MSNKQQEEIKEYADGWITERKGTDVPTFLKVAYIFIIGGCLTYLTELLQNARRARQF